MPDSTGWAHEVVTWNGDGTDNRLISTTFALNTGVVAIVIGRVDSVVLPEDAVPVMRHNDASMAHTAVSGSVLKIADGIKSFAAGGFTIGINRRVNFSGAKYVALVMSDTSLTNQYLRVGQYAGDATDNRDIVIAAGFQPTMLWVWGRNVAWRTTDFTGDNSVTSSNASSGVGANFIQTFNSNGFQAGTNAAINASTAIIRVEVGAIGAVHDWVIGVGANKIDAVITDGTFPAGSPTTFTDSTWIESNTLNQEHRYTFSDTGSIPSGATITNVQLFARTQGAAVAVFTRHKFTVSGTVVGPEFTGGISITTASHNLATNPDTGIAWTRAEIFSTQFGNKITLTGSGPIKVFEFYALVTFAPPDYHYIAVKFSADDLANSFYKSFLITGTAADPDVVTGLGFTPAIAFARRFTNSTHRMYFRGPNHTGTESSTFGFGLDASTGIKAFGSGTIDLGSAIAAASDSVYGMAWITSASYPTIVLNLTKAVAKSLIPRGTSLPLSLIKVVAKSLIPRGTSKQTTVFNRETRDLPEFGYHRSTKRITG